MEKEKEAILAVLEEEGAAALAKDKDRMFALHGQEDLETRLAHGEFGFNTYTGWNEVGDLLGDALSGEGILGGENADGKTQFFKRENFGSVQTIAFSQCDNHRTTSAK